MTRANAAAIPEEVGRRVPVPFQSLALAAAGRLAQRRGATLAVSAGLHSLLLSSAIVLPLLLTHTLPGTRQVMTFFPTPLEMSVLPPPPPAPRGGGMRPARVVPVARPGVFTAPDPDRSEPIRPDQLDLNAGTDPNGVSEGGVPGGVVGSVLTDLPPVPPARPRARVVRISQLDAPRLLRKVAPAYPELAKITRVTATVTLEAEVDAHGRVKNVSVVRGHPLFDDAAVAAVRQWVYKPLLLGGEPTGFILTVTIDFNLR